MYKPRHLVTAIREPDRFFAELNSIGVESNIKIHNKFYPERGIDVMDKDWDNLLILDACRYDLFEEKNTIEGDLQSVISQGSESWEFLSANFAGREFHDTIYVTANPHAPKLDSDTFYKTINLLEDHWNEQYKTVLPETVSDATLSIHNKHPNKRIIAHFMQPHFPFIGPLGRQIGHMGIDSQQSITDSNRHVWNGLKYRQLDSNLSSVKAAYYENFEIILPHVDQLTEDLNGKTVITADHGNLLGERTSPIPARGYGHPRGLKAMGLIRVPWLVIDTEARREIQSDNSIGRNSVETDTVKQRLSDLGYAE